MGVKLIRLQTSAHATDITFNGMITDDLILKKGSSVGYACCSFDSEGQFIVLNSNNSGLTFIPYSVHGGGNTTNKVINATIPGSSLNSDNEDLTQTVQDIEKMLNDSFAVTSNVNDAGSAIEIDVRSLQSKLADKICFNYSRSKLLERPDLWGATNVGHNNPAVNVPHAYCRVTSPDAGLLMVNQFPMSCGAWMYRCQIIALSDDANAGGVFIGLTGADRQSDDVDTVGETTLQTIGLVASNTFDNYYLVYNGDEAEELTDTDVSCTENAVVTIVKNRKAIEIWVYNTKEDNKYEPDTNGPIKLGSFDETEDFMFDKLKPFIKFVEDSDEPQQPGDTCVGNISFTVNPFRVSDAEGSRITNYERIEFNSGGDGFGFDLPPDGSGHISSASLHEQSIGAISELDPFGANSGGGYTTGMQGSLVGPNGISATPARFIVTAIGGSAGNLTGFVLSNSGAGYTVGEKVTFVDDDGIATTKAFATVKSLATGAGKGYAVGQTGSLVVGVNKTGKYQITGVDVGDGSITSFNVTNPGQGYTVNSIFKFINDSGAGSPTELAQGKVGSIDNVVEVRYDTASLTFQDETVAKYFGFDKVKNGNSAAIANQIDGKEYPTRILADNKNIALTLNINYMVVLDSINLTSYDYSPGKESRQNILKNIYPEDKQDGVVRHMANEIVYVGVDNAYDINLKNIRARILHADYSPVKIITPAEMTLYVKGP